MADTPPQLPTGTTPSTGTVEPLPVSAEHLAAALAAVVLAMTHIRHTTREQAHALHTGYLRTQGISDIDIADHWATIGGKYTG